MSLRSSIFKKLLCFHSQTCCATSFDAPPKFLRNQDAYWYENFRQSSFKHNYILRGNLVVQVCTKRPGVTAKSGKVLPWIAKVSYVK